MNGHSRPFTPGRCGSRAVLDALHGCSRCSCRARSSPRLRARSTGHVIVSGDKDLLSWSTVYNGIQRESVPKGCFCTSRRSHGQGSISCLDLFQLVRNPLTRSCASAQREKRINRDQRCTNTNNKQSESFWVCLTGGFHAHRYVLGAQSRDIRRSVFLVAACVDRQRPRAYPPANASTRHVLALRRAAVWHCAQRERCCAGRSH